MNGIDVLDDYLGELLLEAVPPPAASQPVPDIAPAPAAVELPPAAAAPTLVTPAAPAAAVEAPAAVPAPAITRDPTPPPAAPAMPAITRAAPAAVPARPRPAPAPVAAPAAATPPPAAPANPAANNVWAALQAQAREPHQPQHRRASERASRWLRLRCGRQTYALELLKVQEVVLPVPLLGLRGTSMSMLGIMNLRGQVVPVIDLGLHLGFEPVVEDSQTRIVVLEENGDTLGLRVSAVEDVASLTDSQIEPPDTARICQISNTLFRGVARLGPQPMILLDASQLLHCDR